VIFFTNKAGLENFVLAGGLLIAETVAGILKN
jgi:hypothetical protein